MAENYDIIVVKGDTARWEMFFYGLTNGNTFDFGGCTLFMQVRSGYYSEPLLAGYTQYIDPNSGATYPKGLTGGVSAGATGGTVYFCLGSSQSSQFTPDRMCKYDLKVFHPVLGDIQTLVRGNVQVLNNVTQT